MSLHALPSARRRGLSMVELMVGLAVGMVVVALAVSAMSHQARASRRVLLEARTTQELRAATDLLARHVRRAGHWSEAARGVWRADAASPPANPHTFTPEAPDRLRFTYSSPTQAAADGVASRDHFGFRLRDGILDIELGEGNWQPLTDPGVLHVTELKLIPRSQDHPLPAACAEPCAGSAGNCPPSVRVRGLDIMIDAVATRDPGIHRQAATYVRPRNDMQTGQCKP